MAKAAEEFEVQREGQTLILTPRTNLSELDSREIEAGAKDVLRLLGHGTVKNVVMDFHNTDYYGSTALGFFVKVMNRVRAGNGRLAFCGVSDHEKEILQATDLDELWPVYSSREEAIRAVEG
jgi:anti-sigma B factor antagonist